MAKRITKGTFSYAGDIVNVILDENNLMFEVGGTITTMEGLKFDKSGTLKEFPDLKDKDDWQKIAKERFKRFIDNLKRHDQKMKYIKEELQKHGYQPLYKQRAGFRPEPL